jgi:hypothetical protein
VRFNAQPVRTSATSSEAYTPHRMSPSA